MTTCNRRSARSLLQVNPAASSPSLLGTSVPVVTPTAAHSSPSLINDFLENVEEVLDKWKVSSGQPNHLMEWLGMGNREMDHGWLQDAAFENPLEREKGLPGTVRSGCGYSACICSHLGCLGKTEIPLQWSEKLME
jgi:hypothetical protein